MLRYSNPLCNVFDFCLIRRQDGEFIELKNNYLYSIANNEMFHLTLFFSFFFILKHSIPTFLIFFFSEILFNPSYFTRVRKIEERKWKGFYLLYRDVFLEGGKEVKKKIREREGGGKEREGGRRGDRVGRCR